MSKDTKAASTPKDEPKQEAAAKPQAGASLAATPPTPNVPADTGKQEASKQEADAARELEVLKAELAAKEAELAEREEALKQEADAIREMQTNVEASMKANPIADPGAGLLESDLDVPPEIAKGRFPNATATQKRDYANWIREHYQGRTPLKVYDVEVKKTSNAEPVTQRVKAHDEGDAIRRAYQRTGVKNTEGAQAKAVRVYA